MKRRTRLATIVAGLVAATSALVGGATFANATVGNFAGAAATENGTPTDNARARMERLAVRQAAELNSRMEAKSEDCTVSDPDDYNGESWSVWTDASDGMGEFYEYDEKLVVSDYSSDGYRTYVNVFHCHDGAFKFVDAYSSGSDEGSTDVATHDLNFQDGSRVHIYACNHNDQGDFNCGTSVYAVA